MASNPSEMVQRFSVRNIPGFSSFNQYALRGNASVSSLRHRICHKLGVSRQCSVRAKTDISRNACQSPVKVVLISGGVESSVLLRSVQSLSPPQTVQPLFVDYAQKAATEEHEACLRQCSTLDGILPLVKLDLSNAGETIRRLDTSRVRAHVPLPHRNFALLAMSMSLAAKIEAVSLYIAISADDTAWYPSASQPFLDAFRATVKTLEPGMAVHTPLLEMRKSDVIKFGNSFHMDWKTTYSCMIGSGSSVLQTSRRDSPPDVNPREAIHIGNSSGKRGVELLHCGRCPQCRARKSAFKEARVPNGMHGSYRR